MATRDERIDIPVDDQRISGTLVTPATVVPGVLFLHGWGGTQEQYLGRAREIAALGCVCFTVDLRGHAGTEEQKDTVTREDNLRDALAAYDILVSHQAVDKEAIAVVGSSYGGYLAAILSSLRPVRWLALRVPALYRDEDWPLPKQQLKKYGLADYRRGRVTPDQNRALAACAAFRGDVLIIESEHDDIIPHPVIENYLAALKGAHSLTYRVIEGADHALSDERWQQAYTSLLLNWATEMVLGAREEGRSPRDTYPSSASAAQRTSNGGVIVSTRGTCRAQRLGTSRRNDRHAVLQPSREPQSAADRTHSWQSVPSASFRSGECDIPTLQDQDILTLRLQGKFVEHRLWNLNAEVSLRSKRLCQS